MISKAMTTAMRFRFIRQNYVVQHSIRKQKYFEFYWQTNADQADNEENYQKFWRHPDGCSL